MFAQDSWRTQLREKFRNERRHVKDDPDVLRRKRNPTTNLKHGVPPKLRRGAINWEPPFPEGEDEISLKKHTEFLQAEWCRRNPDMEKIRNRMHLTFPGRRRKMNKAMPLIEIKAEYPALFNFHQVSDNLHILFYSVHYDQGLFTAE